MSTVPPFVADPDASFSQIIVPTSDTVRYNYLLRILAAAGKHVLYVGETGTGTHLACSCPMCHEQDSPQTVSWQAVPYAVQYAIISSSKLEMDTSTVWLMSPTTL